MRASYVSDRIDTAKAIFVARSGSVLLGDPSLKFTTIRSSGARSSARTTFLALVLSFFNVASHSAEPVAEKVEAVQPPAPWAGFVEPNFPFLSSVVDARSLGDGLPADNLTPRGIILKLGHECWACFDTDLLRM